MLSKFVSTLYILIPILQKNIIYSDLFDLKIEIDQLTKCSQFDQMIMTHEIYQTLRE